MKIALSGLRLMDCRPLLGGSWVVISRVRSRVTILITHIRGLIITLLITTDEPPKRRRRSYVTQEGRVVGVSGLRNYRCGTPEKSASTAHPASAMSPRTPVKSVNPEVAG